MIERTLIVASHDTFARGAVGAAKLISGEPGYEVKVFCMQYGETPLDFAAELEAEIIQAPDREFVIMADLFGASICNVMYPLTRFPNVKLFTDFNLRLLIEVMADYKEPLTPADMDTIVMSNRECLRALRFEEAAGSDAGPEDF
jgi:PTS system mannose-specific IIA component